MKSSFFIRLSIVTFFLVIKVIPSYSQVYGCTDSLANNYNPAATINNGRCAYNVTSYAPPLKVDPISNTLVESSGLQWAGNSLWSFNDGGGAAAIYRIDTITNALLQTVNLGNATNVDWEDIAFDGTYFYVGDFGNNADGARTDLKIYKFPLSAIPAYTAQPVATIPAAQIEVINFKYADQPQPPVATASPNTTKYDCEAMIADNGKIHLFSKNWINLNSTHYLINNTMAGTYTADTVETLATNYLVTAADKAPGQDVVVLLGYQTASPANHFVHILSDYSGGSYFNGNKRRLDLPNALEMGQAEGITFRTTRYGYISNEKLTVTNGPFSITINQRLHSFDISSYVNVPSRTLPLNFTIVKASQKNEGVQVNWQVADQTNIEYFEVEKSKDGSQFIKTGTVSAGTGNLFTGYNWFDANPVKGNNFYRIKSIDKSGNIQYSEIMSVRVGSGKSSIDVYPNPIRDKSLTLLLTNQDKGTYTVRLFNNAGQQVYVKTIEHDGGSSSQVLQFNSAIAKGIYQLHISNGENTTTQKIVCN